MVPVVHVGDGVAAAELGDTLVVVWKKDATVARWEWQLAIMEDIIARTPGGFLCLDIITSTSSPPDAALRKQIQGGFKRLGAGLRKLVVVPLGNSIWLSVVRTIVRATLLLSGESERQVVASSLFEALGILRQLRATPSRGELEKAVEALAIELGIEPGVFETPATPESRGV